MESVSQESFALGLLGEYEVEQLASELPSLPTVSCAPTDRKTRQAATRDEPASNSNDSEEKDSHAVGEEDEDDAEDNSEDKQGREDPTQCSSITD